MMWHLPMFWVVANFREFTVVAIVGWVVGLLLGSVFLTWLYQSAEHSILIVAVLHTAYNFSTATTATSGVTAAVASTVVMIAASAVLFRRASWRVADKDNPNLAASRHGSTGTSA